MENRRAAYAVCRPPRHPQSFRFSTSSSLVKRSTGISASSHSCGLAAAELASSRAGVSLFSHTIVALGLSTALSTSLQWLRYGKVLRSYSVIKVQVRDRCWGDSVGRCKTSPSMPLVMNVEMEGGFIPPLRRFFEKSKKISPCRSRAIGRLLLPGRFNLN